MVLLLPAFFEKLPDGKSDNWEIGMGKTLESRHAVQRTAAPRDWRRSMSNHVATALMVYTGLQIFLTVKALQDGLPSILPYIALIVLVAAIIPACRWFEKRWADLSDERAADPALRSAFHRDIVGLWLMAIGLPLLITLLFRMGSAALAS